MIYDLLMTSNESFLIPEPSSVKWSRSGRKEHWDVRRNMSGPSRRAMRATRTARPPGPQHWTSPPQSATPSLSRLRRMFQVSTRTNQIRGNIISFGNREIGRRINTQFLNNGVPIECVRNYQAHHIRSWAWCSVAMLLVVGKIWNIFDVSGVHILGTELMIPNPDPLVFQVKGVGSDVTSGSSIFAMIDLIVFVVFRNSVPQLAG